MNPLLLLPRNRMWMASEALAPAEVAEAEDTEIEEGEEPPHEAGSINKQETTARLLREARAK